MRIGIDLTCWTNHRGYGRYTRNLLRALLALDEESTYVGFADAATAKQGIFPDRFELVLVPQSEPPSQAAAANGRRKLSDLWRMSRAIQSARLDLMFFPSTYTYVPVLGRCRCIVVVHDAIAERWPRLIFPNRRGRLAWTIKSRLACWQAARIVTVSHASAQAIRRHLGVPSERLRVIYEAADPVFGLDDQPPVGRRQVLERYGLPIDATLLLYVGGFSPHKNVAALLAAFAKLQMGESSLASSDDVVAAERSRLHLALVGETTREVFYSCYGALSEQVRQLGLDRSVTFTGRVSDDDLADLYRAAACLVLPSKDEGFGLPVVEAMACGTPVVASSAGALPELVGEAGLLVDPDRPEELAAALRRITAETGLRDELRERGLRRAAGLSWEQAAAQLREVFRELAPRPDRHHEPVPGRQTQHV